ncbi:MAG: sugar phosphate isomerase/epimerase, partial [Actinomycetia bacterium]|nr:sugar phosphate isomerase/epimerase [Actinomycetes bacterium]
MLISISTANFFYQPFKDSLKIIKSSGFEYIELAGYWKGGDNWEIAQHLKDINPKEVLKMVNDSGLKIASLHDTGGVIDDSNDSIISSDTYKYLEHSKENIP